MEDEEAKAESGYGMGFGEIMTKLGKWTHAIVNRATEAYAHTRLKLCLPPQQAIHASVFFLNLFSAISFLRILQRYFH